MDPSPPVSSAREYVAALVLLAVAGVGSLWSLSQPWVSATVSNGFAEQQVAVTGSSLYPVAVAGAWVGLAATLALLASSGKLRVAVGCVVIVAGVADVVGAVSFIMASEVEMLARSNALAATNAQRTSAWLLTLLCGAAMGGVGIVAISRGGRWPTLSSRQSGSKTHVLSDWEALDRGADPTK